eukprot:scaffold1554_cov261-Pinguiococcus_pyrenoidosus.AAC.12
MPCHREFRGGFTLPRRLPCRAPSLGTRRRLRRKAQRSLRACICGTWKELESAWGAALRRPGQQGSAGVCQGYVLRERSEQRFGELVEGDRLAAVAVFGSRLAKP